MICNNERLLEMKQNRFKREVNEMRKYILLFEVNETKYILLLK